MTLILNYCYVRKYIAREKYAVAHSINYAVFLLKLYTFFKTKGWLIRNVDTIRKENL